ncbi:MAG TPA: serine hydrolase domain-containing protein [Caulobacteraceae bacterium]|jgi:CubicO group peptidase (beta-lactamase class C family)
MHVPRRSFLAAPLLSLAGWRAAKAQAAAFAGRWSGLLDAGAQQLRLRLEIDPDGSARLCSLDQGGEAIPAKASSAAPDQLTVKVPAVGGSFDGRRVSADRIEGVWRQGGELPLVLTRGDVAAAPAPVQALTPERLAELRRKAGSPALAAAAARGSGPARVWVDGERRTGSGAAVRETDIWHLGSITKSMTATLIGRLVDAGKIAWDDTVGAGLAEIAPEMRPAYREVTFRHLLSHRSGLPANIAMPSLLAYARENDDPREERRRYVRQALSAEPVGAAGAAYTYSNSGYVAAAAILEARLGEPWEQLVRTHVFRPLGLASAGFGAPGRAGALDQPVGHAPSLLGGRTPHPPGQGITDNPAVLGPAGRAHMSLQDLLKYLAAHRDRGDFLKPATWKVLHTPAFGGDYAMGWMVRPEGVLWHNGSNTLWYAEAMVGREVVAAAAANDGHLPQSGPAVGAALAAAAAAV